MQYTQEELQTILDLHRKWLYNEEGGKKADLYYADLRSADLHGANLRYADLHGANLYYAKGSEYAEAVTFTPPEKGAFTMFKTAQGLIVELQVPASAKRSSATSRKIRVSKAKTVAIYNLDGTKSDKTSVSSGYDCFFVYEVGKVSSVENFDENRWNECSTGIHGFLTSVEAVCWYDRDYYSDKEGEDDASND